MCASRAGASSSSTHPANSLRPFEDVLAASTLVLHAGAPDGVGLTLHAGHENGVDAAYDLAARLLGDDAGAAQATAEVLLRAVSRAADGDAPLMTTNALRRAVVRHCTGLRGGGAVAPSDDGLTLVAGPQADRTIAAAAIASDTDGLVALDLAVRHGLDDRAIATIIDRRQTDVPALRAGAIGRISHDAQLAPTEARARYAALPHLPAPASVQAAVLHAAATQTPAAAPRIRPPAAWAIAAAAVLSVLLALILLLQSDLDGTLRSIDVAVAVAIEAEPPAAGAAPAIGLLTLPTESRRAWPSIVSVDDEPVAEPTATPTEQDEVVDEEPMAEDKTQETPAPEQDDTPEPRPQPVPINPLEPLLP
jgi:hypothetical protein